MSDRIAELKRNRAARFAEMKSLSAKELDADYTLTEEEVAKFASLKAKIDEDDQKIARAEEVLNSEDDDDDDKPSKVDDEKSFEMQRSNVLIQSKKNRSNEPKGTKAARFIIGAGLAKAHGVDAGVRFIRDSLDDVEVSKALNSTGSSAAGGVLVPSDYRQELIDVLWSQTAFLSANPQLVPMPMGNITMPRLSTTSQATWIGEQDDIKVSTPNFDQIVMSAKKIAGLLPIQNDLLRRSPLAVESIVRNQMTKQLSRAIDQAAFVGSGSNGQPKGIVNWAMNNNNSLVSPTLNNINNVLANLQLSLLGNNVPDDGVFLFMHPAVRTFLMTLTDQVGNYFFAPQLNAGSLWGYPVKTTTNLATNLAKASVSTTLTAAPTAATSLTVTASGAFAVGMQVSGVGITAVTTITAIPDGTHLTVSPAVTMANNATLTGAYPTSPIILAAMPQVLFGDTMEMYADSSDVASYNDGSNTISSYQRDQTVLRVIQEVDVNVAHPAAVAVTNVFGWLPTGAATSDAQQYSSQTPPSPIPGSPSLSANPV